MKKIKPGYYISHNGFLYIVYPDKKYEMYVNCWIKSTHQISASFLNRNLEFISHLESPDFKTDPINFLPQPPQFQEVKLTCGIGLEGGATSALILNKEDLSPPYKSTLDKRSCCAVDNTHSEEGKILKHSLAVIFFVAIVFLIKWLYV